MLCMYTHILHYFLFVTTVCVLLFIWKVFANLYHPYLSSSSASFQFLVCVTVYRMLWCTIKCFQLSSTKQLNYFLSNNYTMYDVKCSLLLLNWCCWFGSWLLGWFIVFAEVTESKSLVCSFSSSFLLDF